MIFKPLDSLAKIVAGQSPESSTYNSTGQGLPFFQGKADFQDMYPTVRMWCTSVKRKEAEPNDILISVRAPVGAVNICDQKSIIGRGLAAIRPLSELDGKFLYYYLKANQRQIDALGTGSTFKAITQETLKKIEIPVPLIDDQIRIAHLLGKVEGLIAQRKQQLQQLDDLLKGVFLEMFGDPIKNPRQFPVRRLPDFYVNAKEGTKCGPFGSALKKDELVDRGVPVWNMDNIGPGGQMALPFRMWITGEKYKELAAYSVQDGDILISRAGTVGKMCIAQMHGQSAIISTNLIRLRFGSDLRPLHFVSLMLYCKGRVGRLKVGADGAFTHMNTGILHSLEFPYPPIELQDRFGTIASQVQGIKSHCRESLTDLEALYGALSQQAFKGELDLSRVPLPDAEPQEPQIALPATGPSSDDAPNAIDLPDTKLLQDALDDRTRLKELLPCWLEAYRAQLNGAAFSAQAFLTAAQTRIAELHPDNDFELNADAYEQVKTWVFEALASGRLKQGYADADNRVTLASQSPDWGTW